MICSADCRPPVTNLIRAFCRHPGTNCYDLVGSITGKNYCLNSSAVDVFLKYEPQPTSTKTMVHFAQSNDEQPSISS